MAAREKTIAYGGRDITVYFTVHRCTHVAECLNGAPEVFDLSQTPWVQPDTAPADQVATVILRCPTGALHFRRHDGGAEEKITRRNILIISRDGPFFARGDLRILNFDGRRVLEDSRLALCRCGHSRIMPLCDGSHWLGGFTDPGRYSPRPQNPLPPESPLIVKLEKDGPLELSGPVIIQGPDGEGIFQGGKARLCRCGHSRHQPFCDRSHIEAGFSTGSQVRLIPEE